MMGKFLIYMRLGAEGYSALAMKIGCIANDRQDR